MRIGSILKLNSVAIIYSLLFLANAVGIAGTGDLAGGGNGTNYAVYESNIKTIENLNIYPQKLKPIFDRFDQVMKDLTQSKEQQVKNVNKKEFSYSKFLLKWKTWYFTPDKLNALDKEKLGIIFNQEKTQQIAINNKKEIWIDKNIFDKMTEDNQVDLIIHEFVMNFYFFNFYSFYEICTIGTEMGEYNHSDEENTLSCEHVKNIKSFQKKQAMSLNEDDYQNIRRVTNWLLKDIQSATPEALYNKLKYNGFNERFYSKATNQNQRIKLTNNDIYKILNKFILTDSFDDHCYIYGKNTKLDCKASINEQTTTYAGKYSEFSITINENGTQKKIPFTAGTHGTFESDVHSENGIKYITVTLSSKDYPIKLTDTVGDRFYVMLLLISPNTIGAVTSYNLIGYTIIPKVITSINEKINNSIYTQCEIETLNTQKNPIYFWTKTDMEYIVDIYSTLMNWTPYICQTRTEEDLKQLEVLQNKKMAQIKPLLGKTYEIQSRKSFYGNSLKMISQNSSNDKIELEKEYDSSCNATIQSRKNNNTDNKKLECFGIKSFKFLDLNTILVNNKYLCQLTVYNDNQFKNETFKYHSNSGTDTRFIISCNSSDTNIHLVSNINGNFFQKDNLLVLRDHVVEYNKSFYYSELVLKEVQP
jgi:hypothetical protein